MATTVGNKELATIFGVTPQRINQLVVDHGMPQAARGKYDVAVCVQWWLAYQSRLLHDQLRPTTRNEAELRKLQAQAEMAELELQTARGQLVPIEDAQRVLGDAVNATRAKLLALPRKAAGLVMGQTTLAGVESVLVDVVHESLHELATIPARIQSAAASTTGPKDGGSGVASVHTTTTVDGQPMGRSKQAAVTGKRRGTRTVAH